VRDISGEGEAEVERRLKPMREEVKDGTQTYLF
jgi:hypothetical protein